MDIESNFPGLIGNKNLGKKSGPSSAPKGEQVDIAKHMARPQGTPMSRASKPQQPLKLKPSAKKYADDADGSFNPNC